MKIAPHSADWELLILKGAKPLDGIHGRNGSQSLDKLQVLSL